MRICKKCKEPLLLKKMGITDSRILIEHSSTKRPLLKLNYKANYTCTKCNQITTFEETYQTDPYELSITQEYIKIKMKERN